MTEDVDRRDALDRIIVPSSEASTYAIQQIDAIRKGERMGIPFGVPEIDAEDNMTPWQPGDLVCVIGRPGMGKTSVMLWHNSWWAKQLKQINKETKKNLVTVFASWEQSVEKLSAYALAMKSGIPTNRLLSGKIDDMQFEQVREAGIWHSASPIFYIGFTDRVQARRPPMTLDTIHLALDRIKHWGGVGAPENEISIIYFDYLQRITPKGSYESNAVAKGQVAEDCKDLALAWSVPLVLGCQAKPKVDERQDKVPGQGDIEWTEVGAKAGDCLIGLMRPCKYAEQGQVVNDVTVIGKKQMALNIAKQKIGDAPLKYWLSFDMACCRLEGTLETRKLNDY